MTCVSDITFVILFAIFYVTSICNTITFLEIVLFVWVISWGFEEIRQIKDASKYTHLFGKPGTEDYLDNTMGSRMRFPDVCRLYTAVLLPNAKFGPNDQGKRIPFNGITIVVYKKSWTTRRRCLRSGSYLEQKDLMTLKFIIHNFITSKKLHCSKLV